MDIPTDVPRTRDPPEHDTQRPAATTSTAEPLQTPDEEAREILAKAIRNKAADGPSILACHGPSELPAVPPQLTSELLHCLSILPDPWPLAEITINLDTASQWVSKMGRLFCG